MSRPGPLPQEIHGTRSPSKCSTISISSVQRSTSSWALTTSDDGIILIDTLYTYNSEEEIVRWVEKAGLLDPASD